MASAQLVSHGYNIGLVPEPEQQLGLHGGRGLDQYPWLLIGGSSVFITELFLRPGGTGMRKMYRALLHSLQMKNREPR